MKLVPIALSLAAIALTTGAAAAAEGPKDYDKIYSDCVAEAGGANNGTVSACAEGVADQTKPEMNRLYQAISAKMNGPADAAKVEKAQKAWIVYRDNHCELAGSYVGSPMYYFCPMTLNIERVKQLREMAGE
ncbi:lysozyme inhibitor LprI family protein [Inquilinus sp. YAF38]|uniref:lysozyme inhibitor LprI family protein n=1 Tax=Inquilinus sp. YAF38 TaxID=3233084 RepID=UPI003F9259D1